MNYEKPLFHFFLIFFFFFFSAVLKFRCCRGPRSIFVISTSRFSKTNIRYANQHNLPFVYYSKHWDVKNIFVCSANFSSQMLKTFTPSCTSFLHSHLTSQFISVSVCFLIFANPIGKHLKDCHPYQRLLTLRILKI